MNEDIKKEEKNHALIPIIVTILYWVWESQASGNIRIDLLIIYPFIFIIYIVSLWKKFRFYSVLIATLIMLVNYGFLFISYDLFNKYTGG